MAAFCHTTECMLVALESAVLNFRTYALNVLELVKRVHRIAKLVELLASNSKGRRFGITCGQALIFSASPVWFTLRVAS